MKKLIAELAFVVVIVTPAFALADSFTTGVQTDGGTITSWSCQVSNFAGSICWLKINGTAVSTCNTGGSESCGQSGSWDFNDGDDIEGGSYQGDFVSINLTGTYTPLAPAYTGAITIPTSTEPSLTATISSQLTDPGTLLVVGLVAGIPLTFYVMQQLIALLPGNSKNRRG
jgi:hypothetical protein